MDSAIVDRRPLWLQRLHEWRVEHVSERAFMIILALIVGFFAAVAAFFLHRIINQIVLLQTSSFDRTGANWLYLVYPVVGIYLTSPFGRTGVDDVPTILALGRCGINFVWKSTLLLWHIAYLISYIAAKVHIFYVISKLFAER